MGKKKRRKEGEEMCPLTFVAALSVGTHLVQFRVGVRDQGSVSQIVVEALLVLSCRHWVLLAIYRVLHHRPVVVLVQALIAGVLRPPIRWLIGNVGLDSLLLHCWRWLLLLLENRLGSQIISQRASRSSNTLLLLQQGLSNQNI